MDDFLRSIMKDFIEEMKKDLPPEVSADLEELAALKTDVQRSMMHCCLVDVRKVEKINELTRKHYPHHEQTKDAAKPDTFDFGEAIRRLKKGSHLARKGWNGKEQYIVLGTNISYYYADGSEEKSNMAFHRDIGSQAVVFVGTRGAQVGWLASQADMLADDWYEVKTDANDA